MTVYIVRFCDCGNEYIFGVYSSIELAHKGQEKLWDHWGQHNIETWISAWEIDKHDPLYP
jgi:hypothetical protein